MTRVPRGRNRQRGSAMLVTLIIISALLAGAAVLVSMQLASNRSTDLTRTGMSALYCAEAGLAIARPVVAANVANWDAGLAAGLTKSEPTWMSASGGIPAAQRDLDGDGDSDFYVYLVDNDETDGNPAVNMAGDQKVFLVSVCTAFADTPKAVSELVELNPLATEYDDQDMGFFGNNNSNR